MKRICDNCNNFEVTQCSTREICHAQKDGSRMIISMDDYYVQERMEGEKRNCKSFKKNSYPLLKTKKS